MQQISTNILKLAVIAIGVAVLLTCVIALPAGIASDKTGEYRYILAGLYVPAIPFFYALYQSLALIGHIEKNKVFSKASKAALAKIRNCGLIISALFMLGMPYVFYVADKDDAPGVVLLGFIIIGASFTVATAAAVFSSLLQSAIDIKSENDLTV